MQHSQLKKSIIVMNYLSTLLQIDLPTFPFPFPFHQRTFVKLINYVHTHVLPDAGGVLARKQNDSNGKDDDAVFLSLLPALPFPACPSHLPPHPFHPLSFSSRRKKYSNPSNFPCFLSPPPRMSRSKKQPRVYLGENKGPPCN